MWGILMILTRFPEEGFPQISLKIKRSQDLGPSWKNAESAKNEKQKSWCQPYHVGSFNDPHAISWRGFFLKIKYSQDLGPSWKNAESAKNEKQKYWCQPYDVESFNDPHAISWRGITSNIPQNEAFRSRPFLKKRRVSKKRKTEILLLALWCGLF